METRRESEHAANLGKIETRRTGANRSRVAIADVAKKVRFDCSRHVLFAHPLALDASPEELLIDLGVVFFCIDVLGSGKGRPGVLHFSPGAWLGIAVLMEIPMAMILLSRILKPGVNRWANIVAGIIETAAVLLTSFILPILNLMETSSYYLFFGAMEVTCTSLIIWYAWRWPRETAPRIEPSGLPLPLQQLSSPIKEG